MKSIELDSIKSMITVNGSLCALFFINTPENCLKCQLHAPIYDEFDNATFICAGYKAKERKNPDSNFLNNYEDYARNTAPNCPLKVITL